MKAAEAVLECLRRVGITYIFGNPGTTEIPLLDALSAAPDIRYLMTLHESVAVGMAEGYARSGGGVGFVNVHTSAGTSNCLGGIYNAAIDKTPIVVTAGCKDTRILGRECFSEVQDFSGLTRQFTKLSWEVRHAERVVEDLMRGVKVALAPPAGPVFIALPENILRQEIDPTNIVSHVPKTSLSFSGDTGALKKAARLVTDARTPLLVVGNEVAKADALANAVALADLLGLPVMTDSRDALSSINFPHTHPSFQGMFDPSSPTVKNADIVLGIGCKMFTQTAYDAKPDIPASAKIIHFHSNPHEIARIYPEEVSVLTDAKIGISDLIRFIRPLVTAGLKKTIQQRKQLMKKDKDAENRVIEDEILAAWNKKPIQLPRLVRELQQAVSRDAIIVDEAIRSSRALLRYYEFEKSDTYHRSSAGVLGWGVPAALGVKLANQKRQVIAFVGDGSFLFSVQSLWTAAKYNIPVVIIICNNRQYKAVKDASLRYKGISVRTKSFVATDITDPDIDFCQVAAGFGVWAKKVTVPNMITPKLKEALKLGKPAVLEIALT